MSLFRTPSRKALLAIASMAWLPMAAQAALITQYSFEGAATDGVGGRNGTLTGGSFVSDSAKGVGGGQSLDLSAGNDFMSYDVQAGDTVSGNYSVSVWLKPTSGSGTSQTWIGTRRPTDTGFDAKFQNDRQIHGDIGTGAAWVTTAADSNIYDYRGNQWQHVVYSVSGTGYKIYANGVQVGAGNYAATTPLLWDANNLAVGNAYGAALPAGESFNGRIDELKVYNHAVTQADVLADLGPVGSQRIAGLFSTGVDNSRNALGGNVNDPHYTLTGPAGALADATVPADGFPIPPWLANGPSSAWIGPAANDGNGIPGNYTYTTTFDLTGYDADSAAIHGLSATDNAGVQIILNGVDVTNGQGTTGANGPGGFLNSFQVWTPFSISSDFIDGINTLQFVVNNSGTNINPQGLRVELAGFAVVAIPEPASIGMLGVAAAGLLLRRRSR